MEKETRHTNLILTKLNGYARLCRPHQYIKNGFVWLPLLFGYKLYDATAIIQTFLTFLTFCLAASSIYILNDILDIEDDRKHPVKKNRPLAAGIIKKNEAMIFLTGLIFATGMLTVLILPQLFTTIICGYFILNILYSFKLKHIAIIDITCIATGFVLRITAGGVAASVTISPWIIVMTFLLALFLALAKRRDDLVLANNGYDVRKAADGYNLEFISLSMGIMASVIIVAYILYSVSAEVIAKHGTNKLYLTSFWVIIGVLRYIQITFVEERSGSPTMVLLKDIPLQSIVLLWMLTFYLLIYQFR